MPMNTSTTNSTTNLQKWMSIAFDLAKEALEVGEVPVGCVFVHPIHAYTPRGNGSY
ncbi:hypothetical protein HMI54_013545 [Coelomomyces lativittatus]|nr:hypothetical protein HMI54_013545 [Coelomomyces lativittatus]